MNDVYLTTFKYFPLGATTFKKKEMKTLSICVQIIYSSPHLALFSGVGCMAKKNSTFILNLAPPQAQAKRFISLTKPTDTFYLVPTASSSLKK